MKQVAILIVLAALGFAGWKFWPQVQEIIQGNGEEQVKKSAAANGSGKEDPANTPSVGANGTAEPMTTTVDPLDGGPTVDPKVPSKSTAKSVEKPTVEPPESPLKVALALKVVADRNSGQFHLQGTTNLPEKTRLKYELYLGKHVRGAMFVKRESTQGVFRSESYPIPSQGFVAVVLMTPNEQLSDVRPLFGERGDWISGPLTSAYPDGRQVIVAAQVKAVRNSLRIIKLVTGDKVNLGSY